MLLRLAAGGFRDMTRIAAGHPGDLARHLRRQPRRDRRRARRLPRRARRACAALVAGGDRDALLDVLERARAARRNLPVGAARSTSRWSSCASRCPTARACSPRSRRSPAALGVNIADLEIAHSLEGDARCARAGRRRATSADAFEAGAASSTATTSARSVAAVSAAATSSRSRGGARRCAGRLRCPATRASRTARCCSRRWPTGARASPASPAGDDVGAHRAACSTQLGVDDHAPPATAVTVDGRGVDALARARRRRSTAATPARRCASLAGLLAGRPFLSVLTGDASLSQRPMAPRRRAAARDGRARSTAATTATLRAARRSAAATLRGCAHELAVASGQVKTALVLAGLQADGTTEIVEPAPSRDHTERMLARARRAGRRVDDRTVRVTRGCAVAVRARRPRRPVVGRVLRGRPPRSRPAPSSCSRTWRSTRPASGSSTCCARMGAAIEVDVTGERARRAGRRPPRRRASPLHGTTIDGDEIPIVRTRSRCSRSRPRSPTASPRSATPPSCG